MESYSVNSMLPHRPSVWTTLYVSATDAYRKEFTYKACAFEHALTDRSPETNPEIKIQSFISHWTKSIPTLDAIVSGLEEAGISPTVLSSTDERKFGWVNFPTPSFFEQFRYACLNFEEENEYLLFITADISFSDWPRLIQRAQRILATFEPGSLAPILTSDSLPWESVSYNASFNGELHMVQRNDIICLFIHKKIIHSFVAFFEFFYRPENFFEVNVGYGLLEVLTNSNYQLGMAHLRDAGVVVFHPSGKSYSHSLAFEERTRIISVYKAFCAENEMDIDYFPRLNNKEHIPDIIAKGLPFDINVSAF